MMYKKKFSSEILFIGYYGHFNTGDDAFVEVASWGAKKYWNKSRSIFLAKQDALPITSKKIKGYPFSVPKTYSLQRRLLLASTDYLISAGGSTIHSQMQASNIKQLAIENKKKGAKVKIGGIGISIGPFKTIKDESLVVEYLKNIDFLAVRDQASFEFADSLELPYQPVNAFDLAALLPKIYEKQDKTSLLNNKKVVGISVCPVESISDRKNILNEYKRNTKIVDLIKNLDKKGNIHFKFFVINNHRISGDMQLTKETIEKVSPNSFEIVSYDKETRVIWNEISSCDFVISTRLHAAIFACFSDTPFMLNEYHRKCGDFLNNIDYNEDLRLWNSEYDPIEKSNTIIRLLSNKADYIYPTKVNEMQIQAELNFTGVDI